MPMLLIAAVLLMPQASQAKADAPQKERRICRKLADTGSLIARKRECRTAAEWDQLAQAARAGGQYLVDQNAGGIINN